MSAVARFFGWGKPRPRPTPVPNPEPIDYPPVTDNLNVITPDIVTQLHSSSHAVGQGPFIRDGLQCSRLSYDGMKVGNRHYSYWCPINAHKNSTNLRVVHSINGTIQVFTVNKATLEVEMVEDTGIVHTGEGLFWSRLHRDIFYIPLPSAMYKYNLSTRTMDVVFYVEQGIWQCHASADETKFSFNCPAKKEWGIYDINGTFKWFAHRAEPNECMIDKGGNYLLVEEGRDARIIKLDHSRQDIDLFDSTGAPGHFDCGYGYVIGEDDHYPQPGALVYWSLESGNERRLKFHTKNWNMGHISHCCAPLQRALLSTDFFGDGNYEFFLVKLDDSLQALRLCPALNDGISYDVTPKASIDYYGEYFSWTTKHNGEMHTFLGRLPRW